MYTVYLYTCDKHRITGKKYRENQNGFQQYQGKKKIHQWQELFKMRTRKLLAKVHSEN